MCSRIYRPNRKHKPGAIGGGVPRWFPDSESKCPPDIDTIQAQRLLENAIDGRDVAHPRGHALFAMDEQGRFYKAYSEGIEAGKDVEVWHGYPVSDEKVPRQIPAKILRVFVTQGLLSHARYIRLLGNA
jgi:hypothetical protein